MSLTIPSSLEKIILPGYPKEYDKEYSKKIDSMVSDYEILTANHDDRMKSAANAVLTELQSLPTPENLNALLKKNPDFRLYHEISGRTDHNVLVIAISQGSLPLFCRILDLEPSLVHRKLFKYRTPLDFVACTTSPEFAVLAAKALLARGADINRADPDGDTPLAYTSKFSKRIKVTQFFLSRGAIMYQGPRARITNFSLWNTAQPDNIEMALQANETLRAIQKGDNLHSNRKPSLFSWLPKVIRSEIASYL